MLNKLLIFDGSDKLAMKIGEVYGDHENKKWKSISSTSGMMFIDFKKQKNLKTENHFTYDYNIYNIAKLMTFIKYNKFRPDCQTWLDLKNNILKSPDKYDINIKCSWLLSYEFGSYIKLHIDHIYVSSSFF